MFGLRKKERRRLTVIVGAMARYGFDSIITRLHLKRTLPFIYRFLRKWVVTGPEVSPSERLRRMFEELGTTFIKLGQVLSLRRDLIPKEYIREFEKLQDMVAPIDVEPARDQIQKELGQPPEKLFAFFDETPLAAASIAQVHKATLFDGRDVVVKIQRPGIEEMVRIDLELLKYLAKLLIRYIPESKLYDPLGQVEEVKRTLLKELNFETEMRHAQRFKDMFAGSKDIFAPAVISELSSRRVLTMEMSRGRKIIETFDEDVFFKREIARKFVDSYMKQVFEEGFFHADPHPGNIFVLDDGMLCFHDFGMMGYLPLEMRENLADWLLAFLDKDVDSVMDAYLRIGSVGEKFNRQAFKRELGAFIEEYYNIPLKEFSLASIFERAISLGKIHNISISSDMLLLGKAFMTAESLVRALDPEFKFVETMKPYAKKIIRGKFSPSSMAKEGIKFFFDLQKALKEAPKALEVLIRNAKEGKGELILRHEKLEELENHIDRASNRLAFAIVVAAIIIGSSTIAQYEIGPKIFGFSALGIIGYVIAAMFGLRLIWAIMKSGRL